MNQRISILHILVLALLLLSHEDIFAQGEASGGLKGGINFAGQYGADTGGFAYIDEELGEVRVGKMKSKLGFMLGAFLSYKINSVIALQPEIFITSKGAIENIDISGFLVEYRWRIDYVEAPMLLKLSVPTNAPVVPSIYAGPAASLTISTKRGAAIHPTWEYEIDIDEIVKDTDFGLVFGGCIDVDIGQVIIVVDGRYTMGLTSWYDAQDSEAELDIKHGVLSIMAGVASPFGR